MSEPTLSAYVERCQKALAKYQHLRFLGVGHEMAHRQSGFVEAVRGEPDPLESMREVQRIVAGKDA